MVPTTTLLTLLSVLPLAAHANLYQRDNINATTTTDGNDGVATATEVATITDIECGCEKHLYTKTILNTITVPCGCEESTLVESVVSTVVVETVTVYPDTTTSSAKVEAVSTAVPITLTSTVVVPCETAAPPPAAPAQSSAAAPAPPAAVVTGTVTKVIVKTVTAGSSTVAAVASSAPAENAPVAPVETPAGAPPVVGGAAVMAAPAFVAAIPLVLSYLM